MAEISASLQTFKNRLWISGIESALLIRDLAVGVISDRFVTLKPQSVAKNKMLMPLMRHDRAGKSPRVRLTHRLVDFEIVLLSIV